MSWCNADLARNPSHSVRGFIFWPCSFEMTEKVKSCLHGFTARGKCRGSSTISVAITEGGAAENRGAQNKPSDWKITFFWICFFARLMIYLKCDSLETQMREHLTCCNHSGIYALGNLGPLAVYLSSLSSQLLKSWWVFLFTAMSTIAVVCSKRISDCWHPSALGHPLPLLRGVVSSPQSSLSSHCWRWCHCLAGFCVHTHEKAFQDKKLKKAQKFILSQGEAWQTELVGEE